MLKTINNHIFYKNFKNRQNKKKCFIVNMPNMMDTRLNVYLLQIPYYLKLPIGKWPENIKQVIREIDPHFPEEDLLEEKELEKEDILECKICNTGFLLKENTSQSCKTHKSANHTGNYVCCGTRYEDNLYCRIGYHIPK